MFGPVAGEASAGPLRWDEGIDQRVFQRSDGVELLAVIEGERFELGGVFAGDEEGTGVQAVFQGVEAGNGLTLVRAGAGALLSVQPIGGDLRRGCHSERMVTAVGSGGRRVTV